MWCEVGRSLYLAEAQSLLRHGYLQYSPSLGSQMERDRLPGAEQILLKPYMWSSHTFVRLLGPSRALLGYWVHQAEFPELGKAPELPFLPVPQMG